MSDEIYKKAIEKWGNPSQVLMAMGECGELIAELNAFFNQGKSSRKAVISEIADVEIMCGQLRVMFSNDEVDIEKARKLKRLDSLLTDKVNE